MGLHDQGVAAAHDRQDFEAASEFFRKSWDVAETTLNTAFGQRLWGRSLSTGSLQRSLPWLERSLAIWKSDPDEEPIRGRDN